VAVQLELPLRSELQLAVYCLHLRRSHPGIVIFLTFHVHIWTFVVSHNFVDSRLSTHV